MSFNFSYSQYEQMLEAFEGNGVKLCPMNRDTIDAGIKIDCNRPMSLKEAKKLHKELSRAIFAASNMNRIFGGEKIG